MPLQYKCLICETTPDQLSHHKSHLKTSKHKDKRTIFELELKTMTIEQLNQKYNSINMEDIIKNNETFIMEESNNEIVKKNISGEILWNLDTNKETNQEYKDIKSELDSIIKKCHQLLYSKGGSIVGSKAQNDIMRILCLKILQSQFNDKESPLYTRCLSVKTKKTITEKYFEKYMLFCSDLNEINKNDDIIKEWKLFIHNFVSYVFPSIYFENDEKFNCDKSTCISDLIQCINSLEITEKFKDAFSTSCGDIHESFREYGGGKGAKELGQYFTPRQLIHLIFHGMGLDILVEKMENISIYDPCMGTGGFLTRLFKLCTIFPENIYGCETEIDTIKFGNMSMILTTGSVENNIIKCDSLCENPFIVDKKFKVIVTNPPFGTKMKYEELKKTFEEKIKDVKFEVVYPLKTNNGACLFIQHCVYMLEENGVCAIVLPDGELFEGNSKWSKEFRKWWANNVNIQTILKVPSGTFEHAGVKTNVVVFTKSGPTQNIRFMETTKECNLVKDMFMINMDELRVSNYSLDVGEYLVEKKEIYDVPMVALGDVCEFQNSGEVINKSYWNKGNNILYSCNKTNMMCNYTIFPEEKIAIEGDLLISRNGNPYIHYITKPSIYTNVVQRLKIKKEYNVKYIYYYIITILEDIKKKSNGQGIPSFNMDIWNKIKIPLPSPEVQQQIVEELSLVETSIQTIETRISQLKSEKEQYKKYGRKAEIRELLKDCEKVALGDVCDFVKGTKSSTYFEKLIKGEYPVISKAKYINNFNYINTFELSGENLFICDTFAGDGKGELTIHYYKGKCSYTNLVYNLIIDKNILCKYLYYIIRQDMSLFNNKYQKGSSKPTLDKNKLKSSFKIPIPSPEVQQQCIEIFEQKEAFIQIVDNKITEEKNYMDTLKQLAKDIISTHC